jgi:hypothetical protein
MLVGGNCDRLGRQGATLERPPRDHQTMSAPKLVAELAFYLLRGGMALLAATAVQWHTDHR